MWVFICAGIGENEAVLIAATVMLLHSEHNFVADLSLSSCMATLAAFANADELRERMAESWALNDDERGP